MTELVVVVALTGAGLKLDRRLLVWTAPDGIDVPE
jgi:hypothetical protein